jgi:hypothetical protein
MSVGLVLFGAGDFADFNLAVIDITPQRTGPFSIR